MRNIISILVLAIGATSGATAQQAVQWKPSDGGNGHWYEHSLAGGTISWDGARSAALKRGGDLAAPKTEQSYLWLWNNVVRPHALADGWQGWIGLRQVTTAPDYAEPSGGYRWVDGTVPSYSGWRGLQPDDYFGCAENYVNILGNASESGYWNDMSGSGCYCFDGSACVRSYVIEWSADCNDDGIVDYGQCRDGSLPDYDGDNIPDICQQPECADADFYRDFNVNGADLGILLSQWGPNTPLTESDLNHDGRVDGADLGVFLGFWGPCAP